jgi:hypothetical protein
MADEIAKWICVGIGLAVIALFLYAFVIIIIGTIAGRSVPRTKVYDKVKWYGDACPDDAGLRAYVPFGFLLAWLIEHELVSENFQIDEDLVTARAEFKSRVTTGPKLYCDMLDGVLTDDDLNDEGNRFMKWYATKYHGDFAAAFCGGGEFDERCFRVEDTWQNYERICKVIDDGYDSWKSSSSQR